MESLGNFQVILNHPLERNAKLIHNNNEIYYEIGHS